MRNLFFVIVTLFICQQSMAQYKTNVQIQNLYDDVLVKKACNNIQNLLTEFNNKCILNQELNLSKVEIDFDESIEIKKLWNSYKFRCVETDYIGKAIKIYGSYNNVKEYELRNIPMFIPSTNKKEYYAIRFDLNGRITSFQKTISKAIYSEVFKGRNEVTDLARRQQILSYVEQFRTAYDKKDLGFLNNVFSDNALIITGRKVSLNLNSNDVVVKNREKYEYIRQSKQEYLNKLSAVFRANKTIRVQFDSVKVVKYPTDDDWYYVRLYQGFTSDNYHDNGYLFLLWDFRNPDRPVIHVRAWDEDKDGTLKKEDLFSIDDVSIK